MRYRVSWDPAAFRRLVQIWVAAQEPASAIQAFDEIERILSNDADSQGESRRSERRILIVQPIGVIFRARPELGEVLILDAWLIRTRKP
jgi:hypothetical protein